MKRLAALLSSLWMIALAPTAVLAAESVIPLDKAPIDRDDLASLQRGARNFVNYCLGCHSAALQRYQLLANDLGLTEKQVRENLILTTDDQGIPVKVGSVMDNTMDDVYSRSVFGNVPADLSVIARSRGADWLYTYLRSFYADPARGGIGGANNLVFPNVGMPHVLWELQGVNLAEFTNPTAKDPSPRFVRFVKIVEGSLNEDEFDAFVADLVNFLVYLSEPNRSRRIESGIWVLLFIFLFTGLAWYVKKEFWKDIR